MKNSGIPRLGSDFHIVEVKPLFDDGRHSNANKCDIASAKIKSLELSDDEKEITINGRHTVKIAGQINYSVGDIIYDKEVAYEVMGACIEKNKKIVAENLKNAQQEVEAMENLAKFHEKQMSAEDLSSDKPGKIRELVKK